ncbi:signal recognition particle protein [Candidatus Woesearchaeota archaeon]|nr:signal recognition particle protein [Candidatus Woesearchaeota archaeon]
MVLDKLGGSLKDTLQKITNAVLVDDKLINELIKDIQRALLTSDVNVQLVFELSNKIRDRAKEKPTASMTKKEQLVKIVYEELVNFLGEKEEELNTKKGSKIMLVGLFGNGKTTTAGKLARYYKTRGKKVALLSTDTWRPAAYKQLETLGKQLDVKVFGDPKSKDPIKIYKTFEKELSKYDLTIVDTAGRDALSNDLIEELNKLAKVVKPTEALLIIGADIGQTAQKQAQAFHDAVKITGVIITKLDGTAKGGGALAACQVTGAKVKFVGVGEKIDAFEKFDPQGFVSRMLGMGDIKALLEKASEAITQEEAQDLGKRFLKGEFNLIDLYEQMQAMSKMGPLGKVMELIPGMGQLKMPKGALQVQEGKLKKWRFILDSCTKNELEDPEVLDGDRVKRIAQGSGTTVQEVRELLKQYKQAKKMTKMLKGGGEKNLQKLMQKMPKGMKF